jgi:hypothetical protein
MVAPALAMTTPRPRPVTNRMAPNAGTLVVSAVTNMPTENQAMPRSISRRLPKKSPTAPQTSEPTSTPINAQEPRRPAVATSNCSDLGGVAEQSREDGAVDDQVVAVKQKCGADDEGHPIGGAFFFSWIFGDYGMRLCHVPKRPLWVMMGALACGATLGSGPGFPFSLTEV